MNEESRTKDSSNKGVELGTLGSWKENKMAIAAAGVLYKEEQHLNYRRPP